MDCQSILHILSVLCLVLWRTQGQDAEGPVDVEVYIWEEEVMVTWQPPKDAPENAKYLVQIRRSGGPRENVTSCELTTLQQCDISDHITNYTSGYAVFVGLITLQGSCIWSKRKTFTMTESKLLPPVFSLVAQSGSVSVKLQYKPQLLHIFKYGLSYTVSLREHNKNKTIQDKNFRYDDFKEDILFEGLSWGQEYCVSVMVESLTTDSDSNVTEHCIYLNPDKFTVITFVIISVFGAVVFLVITGIVCFLCHPAKMPQTLKKSTGTNWQPLPIDHTPVEVIVTNGWFLSRANPEGKREMSEDKMAILQEEGKRASLDSGVSLVTNSTGGDAGMARQEEPQEDSGCGSLGSPAENENEHAGSNMAPLVDRRNNCNKVAQGEDSGLGLGFNSESAGSSEGEDTGSLPDTEVPIGDGYRSQSPSTIATFHSTPETTMETQTLQRETDFDMAAPMVGYRPSQVIGHIPPAVHNDDAPMDTTEQDMPVSNYRGKTQAPEVTCLLDSLSLSHQSVQSHSETAPLITSLPAFLLGEKGPECCLTTLPLSLSDMELTFG